MPLAVRLVVAILAVAALVGTLDVGGVAGYQGGEVLVAVLLGVTGGVAGWWALRGVAARGIWVAALVVLATLPTAVLVDRAPWSTGRLAAELDELELGYEVIGDEKSGHSWCRPTCPVVVRTYRGPAITPLAAAREVGVALSAAGLLPRGVTADVTTPEFGAATDDVRIDVRATRDDPVEPVEVVIRLEARR